tara:strand:- start:400 stop:2139 length:1740 start_codon:yes stop_codon:yes gene_type:complete
MPYIGKQPATISPVAVDTTTGTFSGVVNADAGITVDNITIDGTSVASSSTFSLDAAGDITIDAGGAEINLKDDGTTVGHISMASSNIEIKSSVSDKDIIFKGNDGGSEITALTLDMSAAGAATFNDKIIATELDISGNADIDGTLEADAITIGGVSLAETISDTVGSMVTSNTESGITVAYNDSDNTLDFTVGTLNQDTTGNAATSTTLETARTIHGVSFNGSANIDLSEVVQDTVGAMFSSNTETGITATYQDADGTIDLVVGTLNQDTTGNAATATTLETARTIHGVSFNGSANIDLSEVIQDTVGAMVSSNTESGITVAYQDGDGTIDFTVGTLNQDTTGSAATLTTARTIGGVSFDGSANINLPGVNTAGNQNTSGSAATLTNARTIGGVSFDGSANINLPGVNTGGNQATSGNAATATKLATARTINGTNFDGSANITISAGKVLQVVEAEQTTTTSTSSTTFVTAHEVTITPSSSSNKVFITTSMSYNLGGTNTSGQFNFRLQRGTTTITDTSAMRSSGSIKRNASEFVQLDSPSTTSATTYRIQIRRTSGSDGLNYCESSEKSVMIAMEIAG